MRDRGRGSRVPVRVGRAVGILLGRDNSPARNIPAYLRRHSFLRRFSLSPVKKNLVSTQVLIHNLDVFDGVVIVGSTGEGEWLGSSLGSLRSFAIESGKLAEVDLFLVGD